MTFCDKEKQLIDSGVTCIDNKFIFKYLPEAPDKCVAVYLLGLALTESAGADNSCSTIAEKTGLSQEEVMAAYLYWEELGLVHITADNPPKVVYLALREGLTAKKIKPAKYVRFNREMQNAIEGRMISPNEFNEYYTFLEDTTFQPEALIAVAKYCVALKGADINYRYILTVARNQLAKGATTLEVVQENLNSQQKYDEDLKLVFNALGLQRKFDHTDRELFEKWTKSFGFTADVVVGVAKQCKRKSMEKLDEMLSEYFKKGALSLKEIEHYQQQKQQYVQIALDVNKALGLYYQSVDAIVDEYVVGWISRGFEAETLTEIAKYCFRSGVRTLAGFAAIVDKLYKNGVTTIAALENHLNALAEQDKLILEILHSAGLERNVTNNDRALFRTWTTLWAMPQEVLVFAAQKAAGALSPMAYINRLLAAYKQKGIVTLQQAQAEGLAAATQTTVKRAVIGNDTQRRTYTDEQLNSLFTALDEGE